MGASPLDPERVNDCCSSSNSYNCIVVLNLVSSVKMEVTQQEVFAFGQNRWTATKVNLLQTPHTLFKSKLHNCTNPSIIGTTNNLHCLFICIENLCLTFTLPLIRCCIDWIDVSWSACKCLQSHPRYSRTSGYAKAGSSAHARTHVCGKLKCECASVHEVGHLCLQDCMRGQRREVRGFPRVEQIAWDKEPHAVMWLLQQKVVGLNLGARRLFGMIRRERCLFPESHSA